MSKIKFTKPEKQDFSEYGLGSVNVVAAIRDEKEILCLVGSSYPYRPAGGRKVLKEIVDTCEEGITYYWKSL